VIEKIKKYICAVCGQEYYSRSEANSCQTKYGEPIPKFKVATKVILTQGKNSILGTIIADIHARPDNLPRRKPHSIIYLIKIEKYNEFVYSKSDSHFTTAAEDEIEPIWEAELIIEP